MTPLWSRRAGPQQKLPALGQQAGLPLPLRHQRWRRQPCGALPQQTQEALLGLASRQPQRVAEVAEGLETPVQLIYLLTLLSFLVVGAYLVVRQVLRSNSFPPQLFGCWRHRIHLCMCRIRSRTGG